MELFKVRVSWKDAASTSRKTAETYAAVHGRFGVDMVTRASEQAICALVGDVFTDPATDTWEPVVEVVEYIGSVSVEST